MNNDAQNDADLMLQAIALAEKGRFKAPPNPWVGCLLIRNGIVVGQGFHHSIGQPHAEIEALRQAGDHARGSTAYVTLEPCCHSGRAPECTRALIKAGISRVVVALTDPDKGIHGKGIAELRQAGIPVTVGIAEESARESLKSYIHHRETGRAFCVIKASISIDGRVAATDGSSQWITSPEARRDSHQLRAESQAIMIGAGTAIADQPQLTVRGWHSDEVRQPLRVVLDTAGRLPPKGPLFNGESPTLILTTSQTPSTILHKWESHHAEVVFIPMNGNRMDLRAVLELLGQRGVLQVLVEGGSKLFGSLLEENLIDQLTIYLGPRILGGTGLPLFPLAPAPNIEACPHLHLGNVARFGSTVRLDYEREK